MSVRSKAILWTACVLGLFLSVEFSFRRMFRVDCNPLYVTHPTIEYLVQPSQHIVCDDITFESNRWSMRSPDFDRKKPPEEIRVMVFGDSVVFGYSFDQQELATSLLAVDLKQILRRHVVVGNISAVSWGVPNYLAYEKEYGFFDADVVVLVASSHDLLDVPTFEPLSPIYQPQSRFHIVLPFGVQKLLGWIQENGFQAVQNGTDEHQKQLEAICLNALREFHQDLQKQGIPLLLVFHYQQDELPIAMTHAFIDWAQSVGVPVVSDRDALKGALNAGKNPYKDFIHLNGLGQSLLEAVILSGLNDMGFIQSALQIPVVSEGPLSEFSKP